MTEAQRDSLIKDMNGLNLTKYISEAVSRLFFNNNCILLFFLCF